MSKTTILLEELNEHIQQLPIAGYIKEEASNCLKYLHRYKLKNIEKNLTCFSDYLCFLNQQNTEKILKLSTLPAKKITTSGHNLSYFFVSEKSLSKKFSKETLQKITEHSYELITLIQGIKGILVLSIDEFCNASSTRICIHEMLMKKTTASSPEK